MKLDRVLVGRVSRFLAVAALALSGFAASAADLIVSAAASLTNAFGEVATAFEVTQPDTTVRLNFASSDTLLQQIAKGAPVDVFATADQATMGRAASQGLLTSGTRRDFASNRLVLITPRDAAPALKPAAPTLQSLSDLQRSEVTRIALGNPASVPAGRYAKAALEAAQLWNVLQPKFIFALSVRQSLDYVARGEVDAGFVYSTDAAVQRDKVRVAFPVPTETAISYPIATIAGSPNPEAARRFVDFVVSAQAQAILARYGFSKP